MLDVAYVDGWAETRRLSASNVGVVSCVIMHTVLDSCTIESRIQRPMQLRASHIDSDGVRA